MKKGPITIKDIALELGISPSTVSRALADNPLVKSETRESIKLLAKKYDYQPNFTALSLKNNQTKIIGIIIPQIVHEFFALVIRGIEDYTFSNGYNVIVCSTHEIYEREVQESKALLTGRVDGVLACLSKETQDLAHFHSFKERDIPLVLFDCVNDSIPGSKVVIDDYESGYSATKHLIEQACSEILFLGGLKNLLTNKERLRGYKDALT